MFQHNRPDFKSNVMGSFGNVCCVAFDLGCSVPNRKCKSQGCDDAFAVLMSCIDSWPQLANVLEVRVSFFLFTKEKKKRTVNNLCFCVEK